MNSKKSQLELYEKMTEVEQWVVYKAFLEEIKKLDLTQNKIDNIRNDFKNGETY